MDMSTQAQEAWETWQPAQTIEPTTVGLVKLGYGDCQTPALPVRSLSFRTETITDRYEARRCLAAIGNYGSFDPGKVADALFDVWHLISGVEVGRENSPVIYVDLPFFTQQRAEWQGSGRGERLSGEEMERAAAKVLTAIHESGSFIEVTVEKLDGRIHRVRAWFD